MESKATKYCSGSDVRNELNKRFYETHRHVPGFNFDLGFRKLEYRTFKSKILSHKEQKVSLHIPLRMLPGFGSRET